MEAERPFLKKWRGGTLGVLYMYITRNKMKDTSTSNKNCSKDFSPTLFAFYEALPFDLSTLKKVGILQYTVEEVK